MNAETQTAETQNSAAPRLGGEPDLSRDQLRAIQSIWPAIDAGRCDDRSSREARLDFCSQVIGRPLASAKDLSKDEAEKVLQAMKQEIGQEWKPRGYRGRRRSGRGKPIAEVEQIRLGEMAADLFGERWPEMLAARLLERFRVKSPRSLYGWQARQMVEELLQRLAVLHIADRHQPPIARTEIEEEKARLRKHYFSAEAGRKSSSEL